MVGVLNGITNFPVQQHWVIVFGVLENLDGKVSVICKLKFLYVYKYTMYPYFLNLGSRIIDLQLTKKIENFTLSNYHIFHEYRGKKSGLLDGNYSIKIKRILPYFPEVVPLINSINLECNCTILFHKPFSKVRRHFDDPGKRNTVIITPVSPLDNYSPTYFYENYDSSDAAAVCKFENNNSFLVNTQKWHDLENNQNSYRINFQICFDESFDVVMNYFKSYQLFK